MPGSFGSNPDSDPVDAVKTFMDRIHFSHVRNILHFGNGDFIEVGHRACEGSIDTTGIMTAYAQAGYEGYVRPDHGRHLWTRTAATPRAPATACTTGLWASSTCSACGTPSGTRADSQASPTVLQVRPGRMPE